MTRKAEFSACQPSSSRSATSTRQRRTPIWGTEPILTRNLEMARMTFKFGWIDRSKDAIAYANRALNLFPIDPPPQPVAEGPKGSCAVPFDMPSSVVGSPSFPVCSSPPALPCLYFSSRRRQRLVPTVFQVSPY